MSRHDLRSAVVQILRALVLTAPLCVVSGAVAQTSDQLTLKGEPFVIPGPGEAVSKAATLEEVIWRQSEIPVCWETNTPEHEPLRQLARAAVSGSWEAASGVRFLGWGACESGQRAVRIAVGPQEWPRAIVGRAALGTRTSVYLNFNMAQHPGFSGCVNKQERCLQFTAIHEFGHVLGLIHEQNRPDTPDECRLSQNNGQAPGRPLPGLVLLTEYDPNSVMNYCSKDGWDPRKPLVLTDKDIAGIRTLFPRVDAPPVVAPPPSVTTVVTPAVVTPPSVTTVVAPGVVTPPVGGDVSTAAREEAKKRRLPIPVLD